MRIKTKDGEIELFPISRLWALTVLFCVGLCAPAAAADSGGLNLLATYPTTLTQEDIDPYDARPWQFIPSDIFHLTSFSLQASNAPRIDIGPADLGIGHCTNADGAVWAIVIPRAGGTLTSQVTNQPENIASVWLRFHPSVITNLFPPPTVLADGGNGLLVLERIPSPPHFDSLPRLEADGCHISLEGEAGQPILLQRSQDLVHWTDWATVTANGSTQEAIDTDAPSYSVRFYRAVVKSD